MTTIAWKVSKNKVFSSPYFPVFSPNAGKCGLEKTPYLDTFHAVHNDMNDPTPSVIWRILNVVLNNLVYLQDNPRNLGKYPEKRW